MGKRYGVITDIHSNTEALTSCLAALESEGVDEIVCCGDIVGYNARPAECVDLVFEKCSHVIQGNHDRYLLGEIPPGLKAPIAQAAEWGREQLAEEQRRKLAALPETAIIDDRLLIVHGSPRHRDEYLLSYDSIEASLRLMKTKYRGLDVCLFGHTHLPFLIQEGGFESEFKDRATVELERLKPYLINVGGCGQPRDGCTKAACGVFDADKWSITYLRVEYDIAAAKEQVIAAGLDQWFAERLEVGK